jgi:hypothetical protein
MTNFNFSRIAAAAVGALAFTTVFVGAAIGPATAADASPAVTIAAAQVQASDRLHG